MERWPSGRRRTLGKRVDGKTVSRVRIPPSPDLRWQKLRISSAATSWISLCQTGKSKLRRWVSQAFSSKSIANNSLYPAIWYPSEDPPPSRKGRNDRRHYHLYPQLGHLFSVWISSISFSLFSSSTFSRATS